MCTVILYNILHVADIHATNYSVGIENDSKKPMLELAGNLKNKSLAGKELRLRLGTCEGLGKRLEIALYQ